MERDEASTFHILVSGWHQGCGIKASNEKPVVVASKHKAPSSVSFCANLRENMLWSRMASSIIVRKGLKQFKAMLSLSTDQELSTARPNTLLRWPADPAGYDRS